jgi:hypothetical protein
MARKKRRTTRRTYAKRKTKKEKINEKYRSAAAIIIILAIAFAVAIVFKQPGAQEGIPPVLQQIIPEKGELVAGVTCENKIMTLGIANNLGTELRLQNTADPNVRFVTNGIVDNDPGCDVDTLAPGESATCTEVGRNLQEGANQLVVYTREQTFSQTVIC